MSRSGAIRGAAARRGYCTLSSRHYHYDATYGGERLDEREDRGTVADLK